MAHRSSCVLFGFRHSSFPIFSLGIGLLSIACGSVVGQTRKAEVNASTIPAVAQQQDEHLEAPTIKTAREYLENLATQEDPFGLPGQPAVYELPDDEILKIIAELRKQYPMESLKERLSHINHPDRIARLHSIDAGISDPPNGEPPATPDEVSLWKPWRVQALAQLHSERANEFVMKQGFGYERMLPITPRMLRYPQAGPVALNTEYDATFRFQSEPLLELTEPGVAAKGGDEAPYTMPDRQTVVDLSRQGRALFLDGSRIGFVRDDEHVAGFLGHGIAGLDYPPLGIALPRPENPDNAQPVPDDDIHSTTVERESESLHKLWKLNRLELVSLLMHDEARVYVSDKLPEMAGVHEEAETRKLDAFELSGLKRLFSGEEVATEATPNRIRMLGALRASESCLECHSVKSGSLLGALSYELLRKPEVDCR